MAESNDPRWKTENKTEEELAELRRIGQAEKEAKEVGVRINNRAAAKFADNKINFVAKEVCFWHRNFGGARLTSATVQEDGRTIRDGPHGLHNSRKL